MSRSRAAASLFAASAIIAASLLGAAPANAATLPPGATIDVTNFADGGINSVSSTTAVGTLVGTAPLNSSITAIDVNQSGQGYAVGVGEGSFLYAANAVTGVITYIDKIVLADEVLDGCQAIDLSSAGVITVSCTQETDLGLVSTIGTVTAAGTMTLVAEFFTVGGDIVRALASNSAGVMYVFSEFGTIMTLDMATGILNDAGFVDGRILGADFDVKDTLWVTIGVEGEDPPPGSRNSLGTLDVGTGDLAVVAPYSSTADPEFNTPSITVWGALAATGSPLQDALPIGLGALLLLGAGVAVAVTHRISKRRATPTP